MCDTQAEVMEHCGLHQNVQVDSREMQLQTVTPRCDTFIFVYHMIHMLFLMKTQVEVIDELWIKVC